MKTKPVSTALLLVAVLATSVLPSGAATGATEILIEDAQGDVSALPGGPAVGVSQVNGGIDLKSVRFYGNATGNPSPSFFTDVNYYNINAEAQPAQKMVFLAVCFTWADQLFAVTSQYRGGFLVVYEQKFMLVDGDCVHGERPTPLGGNVVRNTGANVTFDKAQNRITTAVSADVMAAFAGQAAPTSVDEISDLRAMVFDSLYASSDGPTLFYDAVPDGPSPI